MDIFRSFFSVVSALTSKVPATAVLPVLAFTVNLSVFTEKSPLTLKVPSNSTLPATASVPAMEVSPDAAITLNLSVLMAKSFATSRVPVTAVLPLTVNVVVVTSTVADFMIIFPVPAFRSKFPPTLLELEPETKYKVPPFSDDELPPRK